MKDHNARKLKFFDPNVSIPHAQKEVGQNEVIQPPTDIQYVGVNPAPSPPSLSPKQMKRPHSGVSHTRNQSSPVNAHFDQGKINNTDNTGWLGQAGDNERYYIDDMTRIIHNNVGRTAETCNLIRGLTYQRITDLKAAVTSYPVGKYIKNRHDPLQRKNKVTVANGKVEFKQMERTSIIYCLTWRACCCM